jgi:hypothetical protein
MGTVYFRVWEVIGSKTVFLTFVFKNRVTETVLLRLDDPKSFKFELDCDVLNTDV